MQIIKQSFHLCLRHQVCAIEFFLWSSLNMFFYRAPVEKKFGYLHVFISCFHAIWSSCKIFYFHYNWLNKRKGIFLDVLCWRIHFFSLVLSRVDAGGPKTYFFFQCWFLVLQYFILQPVEMFLKDVLETSMRYWAPCQWKKYWFYKNTLWWFSIVAVF